METRAEYQKMYRKEYAARHKRISITVSSDEYRALQHLAQREQERITTLVKELTFAGVSQQLATPKEMTDELRQLSFLIRNIANNVNQAAHHSNTIRQLVDEQGLLNHIKQLEDTIQAYVQGRMRQ